MCIAILNPNDVMLDKETLKNCWDNNGDGAGMLWTENGELKTYKAMVSFDKLWNMYNEIRKSRHSKNSQVVIHFRISTHGKINRTNCHPFIVNDEIGFVHNGIISKLERHLEYSDTYMFNEQVLKELPKDFYKNQVYHDLIESYIGSSKLLFLDKNNDAYIIGESMGVWDMGCWFSNTTYKYSRYVDMGGVKVLKTTYDKGKSIGYNTQYPTNYGYGSYGNGYGRGYDASYDYGRKLDSAKDVTEDLKMDAEKKVTKWWENSECDFCGCVDDTTKKYQKYDNAKLCNTCFIEIESPSAKNDVDLDAWKSNHIDGDVF
jgi:predicted glutamine amidotransferase